MSSYCEDCGCKVYNGHCVNCHEETYIYEQDMGNDEHVDFSPEFMEKSDTRSDTDPIDYRSNGGPPDSVAKIVKTVESRAEKELQIVQSTFPTFSKTKEFIVLKGHIFHIQSVSPKKLVLKLKGKTTKEKPIPNGIFALKEI